MADVYTVEGPPIPPGGRFPPTGGQPTIVINNVPPKRRWLGTWMTRFLIFALLAGNVIAWGMISVYFQGVFRQEQFVSGELTAPDKIGLISVTGMITNSSVEAPIKELEYAAKDDAVKAVVLRVNSPGGEVFGTDRLYQAILQYQTDSQKPLVVLMEGLAASGGFWVAMPGDKIYATENCVTGSIGVIMQTFVITGLLKEWGIEPITFKTGARKDVGSYFREMTDEDRAEINKLIAGWYEQFIKVVLAHRSEQVGGEEKLREFADGRVVLADEAKELGLIDEIGYLDDAIKAAQDLAGVTGKVRVIKYQRTQSFSELLSVKQDAPIFSREALLELQRPALLAMPASLFPGSTGETP